MNDYLITLGIAVAFLAFGLWNRREIRRGADAGQLFVEHDIKAGWLRSFLGNIDYFSKVTMPLIFAVCCIVIGTYKIVN